MTQIYNFKKVQFIIFFGSMIVGTLCGFVSNHYEQKANVSQQKGDTSQHKYEIMQACSRAHATGADALETICGNLQTKYNMEFVCDNRDAYAYCQVEIR